MCIKLIPYIFAFLPFAAACQGQNKESIFNKYWLEGKAELTGYELRQARYGKMHVGEAVLIFVSEDFSRSKQVKLDNPSKNPSDAVKVMKSHFNKRFTTGVYDYSLTQSVFTPINREKLPHTMKVTTSVQDWCGHTFTQINLQTYKYRLQQFSYFESEADQESIVDKVFLEDEIFNVVRIDPAALPVGSISVLPSSLIARLLHQPQRILEAEASLAPHATQAAWQTYTLEYKELNRVFKVHFQAVFPYIIEGWEETYPEGGLMQTTTAKRKKTAQMEYWKNHNPEDGALRKELGF